MYQNSPFVHVKALYNYFQSFYSIVAINIWILLIYKHSLLWTSHQLWKNTMKFYNAKKDVYLFYLLCSCPHQIIFWSSSQPKSFYKSRTLSYPVKVKCSYSIPKFKPSHQKNFLIKKKNNDKWEKISGNWVWISISRNNTLL